VDAEVASVDGGQRVAEIAQRRLAELELRVGQRHAYDATVAAADRMDPGRGLLESPRRLLRHLHLRDRPAHRRVRPGEFDTGGLPHDTASAVTSDEILGAHRAAVGQRDVDARVILHEPGDFAPATDRDAELVDPVSESALGDVLPEREPVRMPRREVAQVELRLVEVQHLRRLPLRQEPLGDPALIQDLDGARVQTARARSSLPVLTRLTLDDDDVDARQRQLGRQHHPRGAGPGDHYHMFGHLTLPGRLKSSQ
jgi:hypothetical protein